MATEKTHPQEFDLDRTDKLPILKGTLFDAEVADDAVSTQRVESRFPIRSHRSHREGLQRPGVPRSPAVPR